MQYFQRAKEQNKTKEEVRADLNGRLKKLRKLQSEEILKNDFEKKLVRNEIHQIQNLLTWMQIYPSLFFFKRQFLQAAKNLLADIS